jgi:gamma-glutamylcyclotransferase (GGCT)/AIG2-like uncharacterized protein YtfP
LSQALLEEQRLKKKKLWHNGEKIYGVLILDKNKVEGNVNYKAGNKLMAS